MGEGVFGAEGYGAARKGAAVTLKESCRFLEASGRTPGEMLKGILSGRIPSELQVGEDGVGQGEYSYSTILTPKGKMVTDLHLLPSVNGIFLLVVPEAGLQGTMAHLQKYLNPRFVQLRERVGELACLSLVGPESGRVMDEALGVAMDSLPAPGRVLWNPPGFPFGGWILGSDALGLPGFDLILSDQEEGGVGKVVESVWGHILNAGGEALDGTALETLRVEAGRPLFGVDMTEETIPLEAGIHEEAIDHLKGCYTGQEVIVRIRDRGQVNKRLCKILLGETAPPPPGTELIAEGTGKNAGWITSSCRSPLLGQTLALGYVKRGVEEESRVRVRSPEGPAGRVVSL